MRFASPLLAASRRLPGEVYTLYRGENYNNPPAGVPLASISGGVVSRSVPSNGRGGIIRQGAV